MSFKVIVCAVILVGYECSACPITKQFISTITDGNYPYQIIVFLNKDVQVNITIVNAIIQTLSQEIPTIVVDLSKQKSTTELLQNSELTTLHVVIDNDNDAEFINRMYNTMNFIAELTPILTRPKCLLLLWSKNILLNYKTLLLEAWSLKFLNFAIINFDSQCQTIVLNYNPFNNSYNASNVESTTKAFPDKLENMHRYSFKLAVFNESMILDVELDSDDTLEVNGLFYPFFEIYAEKLNFSLGHKIYDSSNYSEMLELLYEELANGNINAVPIVMVSAMISGNQHTFGRALYDSKLVMIVPIFSTVKLYADMGVFYQIFVFPTIVLILYATRLCLKLTKAHWQAINIVAILLGMTMKNQPQRMAERIIFISLVIASMSCSSDLLANLMNIKLITEEKLFNTVQSIVDSGLPIYGMKRLIGSDETALDYEIKSRAQFIASASDCVDILLANKSAICITPYLSSKLLIKQHISRGRLMKLAGPTFQFDFTAFPFERNSPFLKRIDDITLRIIEAGIHQAWEYASCRHKPFTRSKQQIEEEDSEIHMFEIGVFLASAYLLAILAFIGELLRYNYFNSKSTKS